MRDIISKQYIETHHPGGWPRVWPYDTLRRRLREAWWVLTDRHSLHRAWQKGYDQHIMDESARLGALTNYVQNERVRAFNEGVDAERERCASIAEGHITGIASDARKIADQIRAEPKS